MLVAYLVHLSWLLILDQETYPTDGQMDEVQVF